MTHEELVALYLEQSKWILTDMKMMAECRDLYFQAEERMIESCKPLLDNGEELARELSFNEQDRIMRQAASELGLDLDSPLFDRFRQYEQHRATEEQEMRLMAQQPNAPFN